MFINNRGSLQCETRMPTDSFSPHMFVSMGHNYIASGVLTNALLSSHITTVKCFAIWAAADQTSDRSVKTVLGCTRDCADILRYFFAREAHLSMPFVQEGREKRGPGALLQSPRSQMLRGGELGEQCRRCHENRS